MRKEKYAGDKDKIEDKYFKESIPGLNRLLKVLGIPGEVVGILPTEYQNYRNETKRMDLVLKLKSKETLNLEFKSSYIKKEDVINSLDYASYLRIKYNRKTNSYFISTVKKKDGEYFDEWHNDDKYCIQLKTFKEHNAKESLNNLKELLKNNELDDDSEEVDDLLLIPFMESDKLPKELIVECIRLANQITTVDQNKINDIKNLLKFLAIKFTDTYEEFEEIERLAKMEGGMIENTVKQMRRIYTNEGIQLERQKQDRKLEIIKRELKEKGIQEKDIDEITKKAEQEIQKTKNR
ncbi:MAG: hypothetical protein Q4P11_04765 [Methanobrevibacter sp.]|nr:hypothetical protein [Methanobrevibacter sp.]